MKKLAVSLALVVGLTGLTACNNNNNGGNDDVVVKTKSGNITESAFVKELKDRYGEATLQEMVYMKVLEDKYKVSDKEVQAKVDEQKKQYPDDASFQAALQQNNLTEDKFVEMTKQQLLLQKAQEDGVKISDKEMKDYYDKNKADLTQIKASHILVADKKTADKVEKELKDGGDFAKLAEKYSTDTNSAKNGGDLGWFGKGDMVPQFEEAAYKMKVGETSDPVKSDYGYHIIKLTGKKDSYDDLKDTIKDKVMQSKQKPVQDVLTELNKNSGIKVEDKQFKDLFKDPSNAGQ